MTADGPAGLVSGIATPLVADRLEQEVDDRWVQPGARGKQLAVAQHRSVEVLQRLQRNESERVPVPGTPVFGLLDNHAYAAFWGNDLPGGIAIAAHGVNAAIAGRCGRHPRGRGV